MTDPQSINRYVYARNTPLSVVDPTGLDEIAYDPFCGEEDCSGGGAGVLGGGGGSDTTSGGAQDNSGQNCNNPDDPSCGPLVPSDSQDHICININTGAYPCPAGDATASPIDISTTNATLPDTLIEPTVTPVQLSSSPSSDPLGDVLKPFDNFDVFMTNRFVIPTAMAESGGVFIYAGYVAMDAGAGMAGEALATGAALEFGAGVATMVVAALPVIAGLALVGEGIYYGVNGKFWVP